MNIPVKLFLLGALILSLNSIQGQTVFSVNSARIDSMPQQTIYGCPQDNHVWAVDIKLSGYKRGDSVLTIINWGSGFVDSIKFPVIAYQSLNYVYSQRRFTKPSGTYQPQFICVAPDGKRDTVTSSNSLVVVPICQTISGSIYLDSILNCKRDPGEHLFFNQTLIEFKNRSTNMIYRTYTNSMGNYSFKVPPGNYDITEHSPYINTCPIGGHTNISSNSSGIDFGIKSNSRFDLEPGLIGTAFRPLRKRWFAAYPINSSFKGASGELKIILSDPRISYSGTLVGPGWKPKRVNGDTVVLDFFNVTQVTKYRKNNYDKFVFFVQANQNAKIGDTICFDVQITPLKSETDTTNNKRTYCFPVRNSYDPNDKTGYPLGVGPNNIIGRGQDIDYTIRFQNTGNDTAYKVVILDTLPTELDISSLKITGASHQVEMSLKAKRVLQFEFNDINLLDSNSNEPESHGFVSFKIAQTPNLPYGTDINNTAYIYFDFNAPIITNTSHHRVDIITDTVGVREIENEALSAFKLYPNPTSGSTTLERANNDPATISVFDVSGKLVLKISTNLPKEVIRTDALKAGMYFVEVNDGNRKRKKLIIH